jgi:ubiquinone/menaquinone biosynthesis C-methylase UbiE
MNNTTQALAETLSTDKILLATFQLIKDIHHQYPATHLDIGSGAGSLIKLLRNNLSIQSTACDYTDTLMNEEGVKVEIANLNTEKLPFADGTFDIVTCTEVIEHLEHYRETIQEAFRVCKAGGTFVVTTPNILNLKSRLRFLFFGFYNFKTTGSYFTLAQSMSRTHDFRGTSADAPAEDLIASLSAQPKYHNLSLGIAPMQCPSILSMLSQTQAPRPYLS